MYISLSLYIYIYTCIHIYIYIYMYTYKYVSIYYTNSYNTTLLLCYDLTSGPVELVRGPLLVAIHL